jgi:ABC-type glycerol-3-phosphate transport system substrate-binding protein
MFILGGKKIMSDPKPSFNMSRRNFLKAAGLTIAGTAASRSLSPALRAWAQSVTLDLYHDKSSWAPNADKVGELAGQSIGVGFKSVPFPDTTTYQATVRSSLGSSSAPDLFTWWSGYRMEDLYQAGGLEDLTSLWEPYLASGDYNPGVAAAYTFEDKIYAVPFNVSYWIVYYNVKLFNDLGLVPPTTWDEFITLCDTLKGKGVTPLAHTIDGRWPSFIVFEELVLRTAGPDFWNGLMKGEQAYDDQKVLDALLLWKDMMDKGYFTDPGVTMGTSDNAMIPMFAQGQVAMIPIGEWYSASLVEGGLEPGTGYDAFILPNVNADLPNVLFFETSPLIVSAKGKRKEDALKVADWWMTPEAQSLWCSLMGFSTPNASVQLENPVSNNVAGQIAAGKYLALQRYWEATPPDIVETAVDELARFVLNPGDAEDVLKSIQKNAESVWKSRG